MNTYEMVMRSIKAKKDRNVMNEKFASTTKEKMDVFLMNDRISESEYIELSKYLHELLGG